MSSKKHYVITSITLGIIAAASGLLIGGTNLITKGQIARNEVNKINSGIVEIFGKTATISSEFTVEGRKYTNYAYEVKLGDSAAKACALKTSGSNMYGKISLLIGFNSTSSSAGPVFNGLSIVINEQTYATTLMENYVDPLNEGTRDLDDVSCGATYGAKLIRDMVNEAKEVAKEIFGE